MSLEKGLGKNTVSAYLSDLTKLEQYAEEHGESPYRITLESLSAFLHAESRAGSKARTQARLIASLRSFFNYLRMEKIRDDQPAELLESPRLGMKLPQVLSEADMEAILTAIDLSAAHGTRDRAMLETLYSCGLRVSELIGLRMSHIYVQEAYVRVVGKGNKERLVPIGSAALKHIKIYREEVRVHVKIDKKYSDVLFLNHLHKPISRVAVFNMVKKYAALAGVGKNISPHTFRHSFATHLVKNGADLRSVQQMLGHESITTTEIYTHLDTAYLRDNILNYHPRNTEKIDA